MPLDLKALDSLIPGGLTEESKKEFAEIQAKKQAAGGGQPVVTTGADAGAGDGSAGGAESGFKLTFKTSSGDSSNPILSSINTKEEVVEVKTLDDMVKIMESRLGFKDPGELVSFVVDAKEKVAQAEELQKQVKTLETAIQVLPEELFALNQLHWNGQDYKPLLKTMQTKDYSKKADEVPAATLVSMYFPDKVTADDIENKTPAFEALFTAAKSRYDQEKQKYDADVQAAINMSQTERERKKASLKKSEEQLRKSEFFKNVPSDKVKEVADAMLGNFFNDEFFAPTGEFKEDALEKALILKYGKHALSSALNNVKSEAKEQGAAEILKSATDGKKANPTGNSGNGQAVDQKKIQDILDKFGVDRLNTSTQFEHVDKTDKK